MYYYGYESKSYQIFWGLPSMNQLLEYTYRVPGLAIQPKKCGHRPASQRPLMSTQRSPTGHGADRCSAKVMALSEQASGMETAAVSNLGLLGTQACRKTGFPPPSFLQGQEMVLPKQHALYQRMASMVVAAHTLDVVPMNHIHDRLEKPVTKWCNQISSLGGLILYQSSRIISIISALRKKKQKNFTSPHS